MGDSTLRIVVLGAVAALATGIAAALGSPSPSQSASQAARPTEMLVAQALNSLTARQIREIDADDLQEKVKDGVKPEVLFTDLPRTGAAPEKWFILQIYRNEDDATEATIRQSLYLPAGIDLAASVRYGRALLVLPPNQSKRQIARALATLSHLALPAA